MRKILIFLMIIFSVQLIAQDYLVTGINITLPANPDPNLANWSTSMPLFSVQVSSTPENIKRLKECRIHLTIKKGGAQVCGVTSVQNAPVFSFGNTPVKIWNGNSAIALFGNECAPLTPGDYEICARVYNSLSPSNLPAISREFCRPFTVKAPETTIYQPPQAIAPADGTVINEADTKKPITFRWIPVTPKPLEEVTYKLLIFEVKQGQTATAVVISTAPILEREVKNQNQFVLSSLSQLSVDKGSSFAWYVQATDPKGNPVGGNNGMSNVNTFMLKSADVMITEFQVKCGTGIGNYDFTLTASNQGDMNFNATAISITPSNSLIYSPVIPSVILANGGTSAFTGSFNYIGTLPGFVYAKIDGHQVGNINLTSSDTEMDTVTACLCRDCDTLIWNFDLTANKISNNKYDLTGSLGVNLPIFGAEFQVQSWTYSAGPSSCSPGVTVLEESGMILLPSTTINGSPAIQVFNENISGSSTTNNNATKTVKTVSTAVMPNPLPVNLTIGLPGALPGLPLNCCAIRYRVCIKATVFYDEDLCKSCTYIKCFEFDNQ